MMVGRKSAVVAGVLCHVSTRYPQPPATPHLGGRDPKRWTAGPYLDGRTVSECSEPEHSESARFAEFPTDFFWHNFSFGLSNSFWLVGAVYLALLARHVGVERTIHGAFYGGLGAFWGAKGQKILHR